MAGKTLSMELPIEVMKEFEKIYGETDDILAEMTKAGAEEVARRVSANLPPSLKKSKNFPKRPKVTRSYKTPSDEGINTKVGFYGYFINHLGKRTPVPLVANIFEHGTSKVQKQPFFRKSFNKPAITKVMLAKQKELSGGLLDD